METSSKETLTPEQRRSDKHSTENAQEQLPKATQSDGKKVPIISSSIKCQKCDSLYVSYTQAQTSPDSEFENFCSCCNCGNRWSFPDIASTKQVGKPAEHSSNGGRNKFT